MKRLLILLVALAMAVSACGGGGETSDDTTTTTTAAAAPAGDAANGELLYAGSCIACHGQAGEGVEGLGKPWVGSDFINSQTDAELFAFLLEGR
jgi:mono/diheme cytochrome c family protein